MYLIFNSLTDRTISCFNNKAVFQMKISACLLEPRISESFDPYFRYIKQKFQNNELLILLFNSY
jgi:hypothetical protein